MIMPDHENMPRYSFDNFLVGKSNEFAHVLAKTVAERPDSYNPLFIYGDSGIGKTHLLKAIEHLAVELRPNKFTLYIDCDELVRHLVRSIKADSSEEFIRSFQAVDMLLLDNVNCLAGKRTTQRTVFEIIMACVNSGHQVVLASSENPSTLTALDEMIRSNCEKGVLADIQKPDKNLLSDIIKTKAFAAGVLLSAEQFRLVESFHFENIRQVEGFIRYLSAHVMSGREVKVSAIEEAASVMQLVHS